MQINTYTIDELDGYLNSEIYKRSAILPVSPERVISYQNNPRSEPSMPVLFTVEEEKQIIAYRTVLPDHFFNGEEIHPFAWLSGNYVSSDHRRKGISTSLFKTVEEAWKGRLMYTNYAPASKAVYDKTGVFSLFHEKPGRRYYMRSSTRTLLKDRLGDQAILGFLDKGINKVHDSSIRRRRYSIPEGIVVQGIDPAAVVTKGLISEYAAQSLFRRDIAELKWIYQYPWVTTDKRTDHPGEYHFSWKAEVFENQVYHLTDKANGDAAFLWISIHEDKLSIPYLFSSHEKLLFACSQLVVEQMQKYNCAYVTSWHPALAATLNSKGQPFLFTRSMPQRYFVHQKMKSELPGKIVLYDGDGDCVFS